VILVEIKSSHSPKRQRSHPRSRMATPA
jgi:hypothetical protein